MKDEEKANKKAPENGCYIRGLFLEGAAWNDDESILKESSPKIIHVMLPIIHFKPVYLGENQKEKQE